MKKTFEKPELDIIYFEGELDTLDIMNTSGTPGDSRWDGWEDPED